jgi:hypothetical protein
LDAVNDRTLKVEAVKYEAVNDILAQLDVIGYVDPVMIVLADAVVKLLLHFMNALRIVSPVPSFGTVPTFID